MSAPNSRLLSLEVMQSQLAAELQASVKPGSQDLLLENYCQSMFLAELQMQVESLQGLIEQQHDGDILLKKRIGQHKLSSKDEIGDRIKTMLDEEHALTADPSYMDAQDKGLTASFRKQLSQWMLALELSGESCAVAQSCLDRFLSLQPVTPREAKLTVLTCIWTASKLYEREAIALDDLVELGGRKFSKCEISVHEFKILFKLQWKLRPVTPYEVMAHLVCYAEMEPMIEEKVLFNAQLSIDFSICEYSMLKYSPSNIAIGGILCALFLLELDAHAFARSMAELHIDIFNDSSRQCTAEMQHEMESYCRDQLGYENENAVQSTPVSKKRKDIDRTVADEIVSPTSVAAQAVAASVSVATVTATIRELKKPRVDMI